MEYQIIANLLDNTPDQPSKFRKKNWVEINNESKGTITEAGDNDAANWLDERNKGVVFKDCPPFTKGIGRINVTQIHNAQDIDTVMPMYNLVEYNDNYSKTSGSSW